jgi:hypothetical protein
MNIKSIIIGFSCLLQCFCASITTDILPISIRGNLSIDPANLILTSGHIIKYNTTHFSIRDNIRGELRYQTKDEVEIEFIYRGPSIKTEPLASGEIRRQIGLKLRAHDTCNVIYIMWHIDPDQGINVAVKSNPGQDKHEQCGDRGYIFIRPSWSNPVAPILIGQNRTLQATIVGSQLQVMTDGIFVWRGELPKEAFSFDGHVGLRTDNGNFDVEMRVPQ